MAISCNNFKANLLIPALVELHPVIPNESNAIKQLLGTFAVESDFGTNWIQLKNGPAKNPFGIERATFDDEMRYLKDRQPELLHKIIESSNLLVGPNYEDLTFNIRLAIQFCRVKYFMVQEAIPSSLAAQAAYWKKYYNTTAGRGTVEDYINKYHKYVE